MPVQSWGHSQYWTTTDTAVAPVIPTSGMPGYPLWQGGVVILPSLFGAVSAWAGVWWTRLRLMGRFAQRMMGMGREQQALIWHVLDAVDSPAYPIARKAVQKTATTLGFNRPDAWSELKGELKRDGGNAENTFRHLHTVNVLRQNLIGSTLSNPQAHLIVELAYHGFALKVK